MKKAFLTLAVLLVCAALVIPSMAFDPVTANLTPDFTISKAAMPPVRDGVINPGEYTLISAYAPTNEDWFEAKYECVRRYAAASNPAYVIEIYGAWDDAGIYVAVKSDCNDHRANHDTVWKGCGVMIGFVPEDPSFPAYAEYEEGYSAMGDVLREIAYCYDGDELVLNNTTEDAVMGENAFTSYKHDGGFDIYEMFFTWDFISKTLKEGDSFGLGMMISKNLPNEEYEWICFQSDVVNGKIPSTYTRVFLGGPVVVEEEPAPVEEAPAPEAPPAAETVAQAPSAPAPAAQTGDIAAILILAAVAAIGSAAAVSKKR